MIRKIVSFALITLFAVGCERNEFTVPVPAGGGAIPAQQAPSQTAPTIPPVHPILNDPEQEAKDMGKAETGDQVIAGTIKTAEQECKKQNPSRRFKEARWSHSNRWDCIFY